MPQTVAEYLVNALAQAGVERIYGIVGDSLNPVAGNAIRRSDTVRSVALSPRRSGGLRGARARVQLDRPTGGICAGSCRPETCI